MPSHTHNGPSHSHGMQSHTHTGPSHSHSMSTQQISTSGDFTVLGATSATLFSNTVAFSIANTNITFHAAGTTIPGNRTIIGSVSFSGGAGNVWRPITDGTTSFWNSGANTGASGTQNTGGPSNNTTTSAGNTATTAAGSGTAHNNLQPYITCFMWRRTA